MRRGHSGRPRPPAAVVGAAGRTGQAAVESAAEMPPQAALSRRVVLRSGAGLMMSAVLPLSGCGLSGSDAGAVASADGLRGPDRPTPRARFLSDTERRTLAALVDRMIPAALEPGALAAGADEAIDALLAAFLTEPPLIFAGGPFSDRAGAPVNDFERFIPLDPYEQLAWRTVIEGSQGRPEREFNGPVIGLQQIYRDGLARLDERAASLATGLLPAGIGAILAESLADTPLSEVLDLVDGLAGGEGFADLPGLLRDVILLDASDPVVARLVDAAFPNTLEGTYGAPEYGGNRDLVGWRITVFDGDVQPRGWTDAQVINADNPGLFDALLPPSFGGDPAAAAGRRGSAAAGSAPLQSGDRKRAEDLLPLAVAASEEVAAAAMDAGFSAAGLRQRFALRASSPAVLRWRAGDA